MNEHTTPPTAPELTITTAVKFLRADGTGPYSGFAWPLPGVDGPGAWVEVQGEIIPCAVGIHYTTIVHWRDWRDARLFGIETDGEVMDAGNKSVCRRARLTREITAWNPATLRLFACDCAERVLHLFEQHRPHDARPREAIAVARRFAGGAATATELDAARAAARAAAGAGAGAGATAGYAAWAGAGATAGYAAGAAVGATAGYAVGAAAGDAAGFAAGDAEIAWQDARLLALLNHPPEEATDAAA